ncbi:MAG: glycosyl transferase family 2 [Ilumatobacteraceae bacterium]|nr:glycosyl transferase family 2 [Ilumatobacteraceae bacterium]
MNPRIGTRAALSDPLAVNELPESLEGDAQVIDLPAKGAAMGVVDRRRASWAAGMPRVSVVIPTLNEERNLCHVLPRVPAWVDEVLIVDGRSTDRTVEEAKRLLPSVRIIEEPRRGKGRALFAGMRAATGDIVVALDADGSMDPGDIPRYVYSLMAGADFVKGSRFIHGARTDDMGPLRRLGNRALTETVRRVYGGRYSDLCYGYFALWSDVLPYLDGDAPGFEVETHVSVRALGAGLQVVEVPTFEAERIHGVSNLNTFRDGARVLRQIFRERNAFAQSTLPVPRPLRSPLQPAVLRGAMVPEVPTPARPTMSAVVCTHTLDRWDALVRAIDSLQDQSFGLEAIIVVVDHNQDLLARCRAELEGVTVVPNGQQRGLAGARNTAIELASTDVIAFLDDDAWAADDWAGHLAAVYEDPTVVAVGGTVEPAWTTERPEWFPREFDWVVGCTYRGLPTVRSRVRNLIGANMSFRRQALDGVGSFDELLGRVGANGAGCEETELCIRLTQHDPEARIIFEPQARVRHEVPAQRTTFEYFKQRCRAEGSSKAIVSRLVGSDDALSSERTYLTRTLPVGAVRGLGRLLWLDTSGAKRSGAIVVGTSCVARSYLLGSLRRAPGGRARS